MPDRSTHTSTRLRLFPDLKITRKKGGAFRIENPVMGTGITAGRDMAKVLEFFKVPRTSAEARRQLGIEDEDLKSLTDDWFLMRTDELDLLSPGLVTPVSPSIGVPFKLGELNRKHAGRRIIVGAPVDLAASGDAGARFGPSEVRFQFQRAPFPERATQPTALNELWDIDMQRRYAGPIKPPLDVGNVVHLLGDGNQIFGARLKRVIDRLLGLGTVPVTIGGDHSISWFVLDAVLERFPAVGILHFDAHHDLYPSGKVLRLTHGNPFVFALRRPSLKHLRQLGLRTFEPIVGGDTQSISDPRLSYRSARQLQSMSPEEAFRGLPTSIPYYLTFDVDVLDPHVAPSTGTPVVGGLSYYQALELLDFAYHRFNLIGADFVEVTRSATRQNVTAQVVAQFLLRFLLAKEAFGPLEGVFREGAGSTRTQ